MDETNWLFALFGFTALAIGVWAWMELDLIQGEEYEEDR